MATCRDIITRALRKLNEVHEGQPAPTAYAAKNALAGLQGWYDGAMATGLFGRLSDVTVADAYTAKEYERIVNTTVADVVVTLPDTIVDAETGDTRVPLDLVPVIVINPVAGPLSYIYDRMLGQWVGLNALTLDSEAPLSRRGADGLACLLAVVMSDEFSGAVGAATTARARAFLASISQRNSSVRRTVEYEYF
jgi:hypothetical protein